MKNINIKMKSLIRSNASDMGIDILFDFEFLDNNRKLKYPREENGEYFISVFFTIDGATVTFVCNGNLINPFTDKEEEFIVNSVVKWGKAK